MPKNKGHENLIPLAERSEEERKAIASKGGKAKAEKEKQRKAIAEVFNEILYMENDDTDDYIRLDHHFDNINQTSQSFHLNVKGKPLITNLCAYVVKEALDGNIKAIETIFKYIDPVE